MAPQGLSGRSTAPNTCPRDAFTAGYCLKHAFGHVSRLLATFPTFWGPVEHFENFEILVGQAPLGTSLVWLRRASQAAAQLQIPARGTRSGRDIA